MSYLLLKQRRTCPRCHRIAVPENLPGVCRSCNVMLFRSDQSFELYAEQTADREYYVFNTQLGWMHSTQLKDPQALSRDYKPPKLPDGYGTKTAEQRAKEAIQDSRRKLTQ